MGRPAITYTDGEIQRDVLDEPHRGIRVPPTSAGHTDADIAGAAVRALEWDAFVRVEDLEVTVSAGWVVIHGEVEWEYQRQAAERSVRRLAGVCGVTEAITVRPHATPTREELKRRIAAALVRGAETDGQRVTIEIMGGAVALRGTVRSWLERAEAERVAWSTPDVTEVENHVTVRR